MALQVWLPLNGDVHNQGLATISTVGSPTFANDGKIGGSSLSNSLGISNFSAIPCLSGGKSFTFCFWIKPISASATFFDCGNTTDIGTRLHFAANNNVFRFGFRADDLDGPTLTAAWNHIACVYDGSKKYIYHNGILNASSSSGQLKIPNTNFTGNFYCSYGYMNDFRLYDHVLSPKEVKLISQGLVLHYPLNRDGFGQDNLVTHTYLHDSFWTNNSSGATVTDNKVTITSPGEFYQNYGSQPTTSIASGTQLTLSCYIYENTMTTGNRRLYYACSPGWYFHTIPSNFTGLFVVTFNAPVELTKLTIDYDTRNMTAGQKLVCGPAKLELGNKATPWVPNSNDATYTSMAVSSNVISDASGYSYNGTTGGTIIYIADTPRYSVATNFAENTSTVTITPCFSSGQQITEMSVSCWFKTNTLNSTAPNVFSLGENSFFRSRLGNATSIWYYIRVGSTQCSNTFAAGKTLTDNTWHLLVVTASSGVIKVYVDGVLIGTGDHSATAKYLTCSNVGTTWHLAGYTANSQNFIGSLSDFRIYATALSADDVQKLYRSFASVTGNGSLLTYSFSEL